MRHESSVSEAQSAPGRSDSMRFKTEHRSRQLTIGSSEIFFYLSHLILLNFYEY